VLRLRIARPDRDESVRAVLESGAVERGRTTDLRCKHSHKYIARKERVTVMVSVGMSVEHSKWLELQRLTTFVGIDPVLQSIPLFK
jgi:hypothetical protein